MRPPADCVEVTSETRCRATSSTCAGSSSRPSLPPDVRATRTYLSTGACVTYDFDLAEAADPSLVVELESALAFQPRSELVAEVERRSGLSLCGVGAPPCTGGEP